MDPAFTGLMEVLKCWAAPHMNAGRLPALSPALLLATIIGPALTLIEIVDQEESDELNASALARRLASCVVGGIGRASADTGSGQGGNHQQKAPKTSSAKFEEANRQPRLQGL